MPDQEDAPKPQEKDSSSATESANAGADADADVNANADAKEAAQKALEDSKELLNKGVKSFKKLDVNGQVYLVGLAVVLLFSTLFKATSADWKREGAVSEYRALELKTGKDVYNKTLAPKIGDFPLGKIALLAALGGIGIFVWNLMAKKKESWVPLALIGCAGMTVLMLLIIMMTAGGRTPDYFGLGGGLKFDIDMTLIGFWVPFVAAVAATVVSAKQVLKA